MSTHRPRYINKPHRPSLKLGQFTMLKELFEKKQWDIDEKLEISYFERYVRMLTSLREEQQAFMIKLTDRFLHLPQTEYLKHLLVPISKLRGDFPEDNLLFACCLPKADIGKVKSSTAVLYQFKGSTIRSKVDLGKHFVIEAFTPKHVSSIGSALEKSHFVLVDDFIGTGETAIGAIEYIHEIFPDLEDNVRISALSIVAMKQGVEAIQSIGASVYTDIICTRGISDYYTGTDLNEALEMMHSIEDGLKKLKPEFRFGYGQSEALVCMERCPNNTFPIYWFTHNNAPYERH